MSSGSKNGNIRESQKLTSDWMSSDSCGKTGF